MAKMTSCKTCDKEISSAAKACPHCGQPNPVPVSWVGVILFLVVGFFLLSAMAK